MPRQSKLKEYLWLALVGGVLIAALLVVRAYSEELSRFIDQHPFWGVFLYILLNIVDAVIAPGATLPLVPVAANAWGHIPAALITTAGWTAGALVAFFIAREWGAPLVKKITSLDRLKQMRKHMPQDLFWSIVLMRLAMPMDVVSYVVGLFSDMSWERYVLATALGLTPSAFVLAYLGKRTHGYEIITLGVAAVVVIGWIVIARRRHTRRRTAAAA
jgi:uncharacterized membrane protein YdjX (TVP38/TMEM64 family)